MKGLEVNIKAIKEVAYALGELNERVVFIGGSVVGLYVSGASTEEIRPTEDVDISFHIASLTELENLREEL
ncbi:MAG: hypothetical protein AAGA10_19405 [Bacteroidota bacterium]